MFLNVFDVNNKYLINSNFCSGVGFETAQIGLSPSVAPHPPIYVYDYIKNVKLNVGIQMMSNLI